MSEYFESPDRYREDRSRPRDSWEGDWDYDDLGRMRRSRSTGFRCPYCRTSNYPITSRQISGAGWAVFVIMLLFCFLLFWVGLLITEEKRRCSDCGMNLG
jgi:hypothetical protein